MNEGGVARVEAAIEHGAAAVLAGGVFWVLFALGRVEFAGPGGTVFAAVGGVLAYLLTFRALRRIASGSGFKVPEFAPADFIFVEMDELLLTQADQLQVQPVAAPDELLLDDILTELGADSRVVRLFDPAAMPTPAQLDARIQTRFRDGSPQAPAPADASQALYEALSELRRSLR